MRIYLRWRRSGRSVRVMRWFFLLILSASAVWAQPLVVPAIVSVPDPGNYGTTGSGSVYGGSLGFVRHKFFVSAYEVSNDEYCRFLNAVEGSPSQSQTAGTSAKL